jgi:hypothetical protein
MLMKYTMMLWFLYTLGNDPMWHLHTQWNYYTILKRMKVPLEDIMVSEINQAKKDSVWSLSYES